MAKAEIKAVLFKNFTDEKFVCSWDGVPYTFSAGQEMYVEDWKAEHFAKHLVDKVINKMSEADNRKFVTNNQSVRAPLLAQALPAETLDMPIEELIDVQEKSKKVGRPSKKVVEEEFADLKK